MFDDENTVLEPHQSGFSYFSVCGSISHNMITVKQLYILVPVVSHPSRSTSFDQHIHYLIIVPTGSEFWSNERLYPRAPVAIVSLCLLAIV